MRGERTNEEYFIKKSKFSLAKLVPIGRITSIDATYDAIIKRICTGFFLTNK